MKNDKKIELLKTIDRYIQGKLSQDEIDGLWKQFLENPEYYQWFETELHIRDLIRKGEIPKGFKNSNGKKGTIIRLSAVKTWLLATAAVILIAVGLQFFSISEQDALQKMALSSIDISEMAGAEIYRSDDEEAEEVDIAINDALAAAYDDEADLAILQFRQLLEGPLTDQQKIQVEMNLGILLYNRMDYADAKIHFLELTGTPELDRYVEEKSWWFLGNAHLNLGEVEEAREAVFNAYTLEGRFQSPALALLKKLDVQLGYVPSVELD